MPDEATGTITDSDAATISFASATSSGGSGRHACLRCASQHILGRDLTANVSVDIVDLLNGNATAVDDHTYAAQTVTFNTGDGDGTLRTVSLMVIDDSNVEGDETVNFGLANLVDGTLGQISLGATGAPITFSRLVDHDGDVRDGDGDGTFETLFPTTGTQLTTARLQPPARRRSQHLGNRYQRYPRQRDHRLGDAQPDDKRHGPRAWLCRHRVIGLRRRWCARGIRCDRFNDGCRYGDRSGRRYVDPRDS